MMKNNYTIDFTRKVLTITKEFADAASDPTSKEYKTMRQFQKDIPDLTVVRKTHSTPKKYYTASGRICTRNQFKNLTYKYMEAFINALSNREEIMNEYYLIRYPMGDIQHNKYKAVREWFIGKFPEYYTDPFKYLKNASPERVVAPIVKEDKAA